MLLKKSSKPVRNTSKERFKSKTQTSFRPPFHFVFDLNITCILEVPHICDSLNCCIYTYLKMEVSALKPNQYVSICNVLWKNFWNHQLSFADMLHLHLNKET